MKKLAVIVVCMAVWVIVTPLSRKNLPEVKEIPYGSVSAAEINFDEADVLFSYGIPDSNDMIRIVDNNDYFSFAPSSVTIYKNSDKIACKRISNDGAKLYEYNFGAWCGERFVYLTLRGDEQEPETISIPLE